MGLKACLLERRKQAGSLEERIFSLYPHPKTHHMQNLTAGMPRNLDLQNPQAASSPPHMCISRGFQPHPEVW